MPNTEDMLGFSEREMLKTEPCRVGYTAGCTRNFDPLNPGEVVWGDYMMRVTEQEVQGWLNGYSPH